MIKQADRRKKLFHVPKGKDRPPRGVRAILLATCTGVSFAHGSNDGQKGVGLVLLILIGAMPAAFSVKPQISAVEYASAREALHVIDQRIPVSGSESVRGRLADVRRVLDAHSSAEQWSGAERQGLRASIVRLGDELRPLEPYSGVGGEKLLKQDQKPLRALVEFAPHWVVVMVALSLGLGTLIGWKRVVVTVGERIGKAHLNYAQGAAAESVAMAMIGFAAFAGVPVSTTHVLSSAITGTMTAQKSGVQMDTIRKILLAWVLTLPVSIGLAGALFLLLRVVFNA